MLFGLLGKAILGLKLLFLGAFALGLNILFFFIPALTFNPEKIIPDIEKDLSIAIPHEHTVIEKHRDELGFEINVDVTFQFSEKDFTLLENQVKNRPELWKIQNANYEFSEDLSLSEHPSSISAILKPADRTLYYHYWAN